MQRAYAALPYGFARYADGSLIPAQARSQLRLSGGAPDGTQELAAMGSGAQLLAVGWHGRLPEPVLAGSTATYPEVRPGVDLVVEALNTGFEYFLVVKTRQAARALGRVAGGHLTRARACWPAPPPRPGWRR